MQQQLCCSRITQYCISSALCEPKIDWPGPRHKEETNVSKRLVVQDMLVIGHKSQRRRNKPPFIYPGALF